MLPARIPKKACAQCGEALERRKSEARELFANRKFCGQPCYFEHQRANRSFRSRHLRLYGVWRAMLQRCTNAQHPCFASYGKRGIDVCEEWLSFENFVCDMSPRPVGKSLDRIDNNVGYSKANCRWATNAEQQRNRRDNIFVDVAGRKVNLTDYCAERGLTYSTITRRIRQGWSVKRAVETPINKNLSRFVRGIAS